MESVGAVVKRLNSLGFETQKKSGNNISIITDGDRVSIMKQVASSIGGKYNPKGAGSSIGRVELGNIKILVKAPAGLGKPDAKTTKMQELASAWVMRRAIKDNYNYKTWEDIRFDPKFKELVKIYPDVDNNDDWVRGFFAQQERMLKEFSGASFDEFNRDGGFMDYITKMVSNKFGINPKDTWNPADIWLIKNESQVRREINETLSNSKASATVAELNAVLRKLYHDRRVVGISLKKISGNIARYEEYNLDGTELNDNYNYEVSMVLVNLGWDLKKSKFETQDSIIKIKGKGTEYKFQIKGNATSRVSNLKWEPVQKGAGAARVGKAPVSMVEALLKDNGLRFSNNHRLYPKTSKEYSKVSSKFEKMFLRIKSHVKGVNSAKDFSNLMMFALDDEGSSHVAVSKLMQIHFISEVMSLSKNDVNSFMTDMVFLSAKRGKQFGPFGKLF